VPALPALASAPRPPTETAPLPELEPAAQAVVAHAREVADAALDGLRPRLLAASGEVVVEAKADGTPVTDADREADEVIAAAITAAFPGHGVLSEERDTVAPDTEWTWIVDPIDGTSNFTCRLPYWCVSLALAFRGEPVLGIIDAPVLGRRYVAATGQGAYRDGRRLAVRGPVDWRDGRNRHIPVMLTTSTAKRARGAGLRLNPRVMGSTALDLAVVAEGVAAASLALFSRVWDVAAGGLLVREAGGAVITVHGDPLFPLQVGREHRDLAAPTAAGADEAYITRLIGNLLQDR
jgi:myo-inositol-1(or 4)-monophosphatase